MTERKQFPAELPKEMIEQFRPLIIQGALAIGAPLDAAEEIARVVFKAVGDCRKAVWDGVDDADDHRVRMLAIGMALQIGSSVLEHDLQTCLSTSRAEGHNPVFFVFPGDLT